MEGGEGVILGGKREVRREGEGYGWRERGGKVGGGRDGRGEGE